MIYKKKGIKVGVGFELDSGTIALHIDAMALMLDNEGKLVSDKHYIFFNNLISPDSSVEHLGSILLDNTDDEQIIVVPDKISSLVKRIIFFVNIHNADKKNLNFSPVNNLYIKFFNLEKKQELAEYRPEVDENYKRSNLIVLSELINVNNEWQIQALGDYYKINLSEFIEILSSEYSYDNFKEKYFNNNIENNSYSVKSIIDRDIEAKHYKILESEKNNTDDEIKKKYKELAKSFHPDIIASKNLHKDIVNFANQRFKEIKEAYDYIKEKRKF